MTSAVQRSLYRSLLREAEALDNKPLVKVLWPMPKKLMESLEAPTALYSPGGRKYAPLVKHYFRTASDKTELGFEVLAKIRQHNNFVSPLLPKVTKDHAPLMEALKEEEDKRSATHRAKPITLEPQTVEHTIGRKLPPANDSSGDGAKSDGEKPKPKFEKTNVVIRKEYPFDLKVGMGLVAHPLSSAHVDRRVMQIVEKNSHTTVALVLDMIYSYPLSHGNPMFPEVLWGHEVYNGGYCHVDYTMPPTANVSVLHTMEPPTKDHSEPEYNNWLSWIKSQAGLGNAESSGSPNPAEYHKKLCKPIIKGKDGEPTLYYSKVEALPYLSTLCPGRPHSHLRVYWGCMKWPTSQITADIINGHWMPVELSPSFFGAYPVKQGTKGNKDALVPDEGRFPTLEDLQDRRELRKKVSGVDVTPPQTFPPDHPMCRREALWDQVLYSLGGEHAALVGSINPFVKENRGQDRIPVNAEPASLLENPNPADDSSA